VGENSEGVFGDDSLKYKQTEPSIPLSCECLFRKTFCLMNVRRRLVKKTSRFMNLRITTKYSLKLHLESCKQNYYIICFMSNNKSNLHSRYNATLRDNSCFMCEDDGFYCLYHIVIVYTALNFLYREGVQHWAAPDVLSVACIRARPCTYQHQLATDTS